MHGLAVDAYAASHGGDGGERRDRQSVLLHLTALCAVLERGYSSRARIALLQRLAAVKRDYPALERPAGAPARSFLHAAAASDLADYDRRVREWAQSVWDFWAPAHAIARSYVQAPRSPTG